MKNIIFLLASLIPFIATGLSVDYRNAGNLIATFITGIVAFVYLKNYGDKNPMAAGIIWLLILGLGTWLSTLC